MNHCCICDKRIIGTSWICSECAKRYKLIGKKFSEWPSWVKALHDFEWKERNRNKEISESGYIQIPVTFEDLENIDCEIVDVF